MTNTAQRGKPYAGNPHVRVDEGEDASVATPRRGSLLYKKLLTMIGAAAVACCATAATLSVTKDTTLTANAKYDSVSVSENATLNLAGYSLEAGSVSGGGTVVSANIVSAAFTNDYELLAYVKTPSNNTDTYLDTGYKPGLSTSSGPGTTDRMETKVQFDGSLGSEPNYGIWSMRTEWLQSDQNRRSTTTMLNTGKLRYDYHNNTATYSDNTVEQGKEYALTANYNDGYFYVNGEKQSNRMGVVGVANWTVFTNVFLFCVIDLNRTAYTYKTNMFASDMRMYYFRAYGVNGNLKIDLVPARRKADNTVGFYDRVGEKFIAPLSGSLIAGDVVTPAVDLTVSGGTCRMSATGGTGTVGNLFNDNFTYNTDSTSRYFHNVDKSLFPLRIDYDFGEGNAQAVNMYRIWGGGNGEGTRSPSEWELWGSDSAYGSLDETSGWTRLDSGARGGNLEGVAANTTANSCLRSFANETPYRYYRLIIKACPNSKYFDMTQIEYFRVGATATPGELHLTVADGTSVTNSTLTLGGDMKFVKSGAGMFMSSVSNQFYTGSTDVKSGEFVVGAPLSTAMTVSSGATLGFNFTSRDAVPLLTLGSGTSVPSTLGVSLYRDGEFTLPGRGVVLTSGYDFSGTTINFTKTDWARRLVVGDGNNLWAYGLSGFIISFY